MSPSSSHDTSPPPPSGDDGRPHTPGPAQKQTRPDSPGKDPNSTPAKASATSTAHAFDPPNKKALRAVYTGLEAMEYHMKQVSVEEMLEKYIPGPNIPNKHLSDLHYVENASSLKPEWKLNTQICRLAQSVTSLAQKPKSKSKKSKKGKKGKKGTTSGGNRPEYPIVTRDIANWNVNDKRVADADQKRSTSNDGGAASGDLSEDVKTDTRVDVGVFFKNERFEQVVMKSPEEFVKKSRMDKKDKEERKEFVGNCSWADIVVPIEVKIDVTRSAFYFDNDPGKFLRTDFDDGREALGQLGEYVGQVFGHQHRVHTYAVYVYKDRARLLFFDRQGVLVSEPFTYGTRKDLTLHTFFYRLAHMSRAELGFDPTVVPAKPSDVDKMREYAPKAPTDYIEQQIYRALSIDPKSPEGGPVSTQWPAYELTMCGERYIIARPTFASPALFGRCTRGYLAYDIGAGDVKFIKDSWRLDLEQVQAEHKVYERLKCKGVTDNIMTCLGYEDVPASDGSWQRTRSHKVISSSRPARGHYRLFFKEVCRPLIDFADFKELTMLMCDAMHAHCSAWGKAGVLHRDVSVSNIMIFEKGRCNVERVGVLCDWDLCKYLEQMSPHKKPRTPDRTGTWYFRSALSLLFPGRPYQLSDDIESFIHVYHYCVLRFHETDAMDDLANHIEGTYDAVRVRPSDGAHIGGKEKLKQMSHSRPPVKVANNPTLDRLLVDIAKLCSQHYSTLDIDAYRKAYDPFPERPVTLVNKGATRFAKFAKRRRSDDQLPPMANVESAKAEVAAPDGNMAEVPSGPLRDHEALFDLFVHYVSGVPNEKDEVVLWPETSTKCEDLFKGTRVAPRKNNHFSSSYRSFEHGYSMDEDERPSKKRKADDGSALADVEENVEDEGGR